MASQASSVSIVSDVSARIFPPAAWATLAKLLANQDVVVMPNLANALTHEDGDAQGESAHRKASALALTQHWASMGFVLTKEDALALCKQDTTTHAWLHKHVTDALKERLGGHVRMTPMYPNFPKQVMQMDEAELLFNALLHYVGDLFDMRIVPETEEKKRKKLPKAEMRERALRVVDVAGMREVLSQLTQMNTVWTPAQTVLAKHALPLMLAWNLVGPSMSVPQRENQAHLMGAWLTLVREGKVTAEAWPAARVSTTDVLRACVAYSGGDPSLASTSPKVRFAKLSRPQRRVLMQALEMAVTTTAAPLEDLHRDRSAWLRLAEQLHVGEWTKMPQAQAAVTSLRNEVAPVSWNGKLDALVALSADKKVLAQVCALMEENPGFAARSLRRLLVWAPKGQTALVETFARVADRIDTPLLLSVDSSFQAEVADPGRARVMLPKGAAAWRYRVEGREETLELTNKVCQQVSQVCQETLKARFAALGPLGKVFVEPGLDEIIVPKGLRSASDSVGTVTRGSWLPLGEDAKVVRLFLWWKDTDEGRVDVDLSAVGVTDDFQPSDSCNFHSLKESGMVHSGDLTSAPDGAAEYIDVRLSKLNKHTRYIVLTANVYQGPGFSGLPECFVGWQEREQPQRGDIMDISTVVEKFPVTTSSKGFLGVVFDVRNKRLMWLDLPIKTRGSHSIHDSRDNVQAAVEDFQLYAASQPKIGHLVELHIAARDGVRVEDVKEADVVFSLMPRLAKKGQIVIAATQPQSVASALMQGAKRTPKAESSGALEAKAQEDLTALKPAKAKARSPR